MELTIGKTTDFSVTGNGAAASWEQAAWQTLTNVSLLRSPYVTRIKALYSDSGLYILYHCEDQILSCTELRDFDDIFREDVVEIFLQPDESQHVYFEYELSPLGVELPLLVIQNNKRFMGWRPWKYEAAKVQKQATILGGEKKTGAAVAAWMVEFFVPFKLLNGMANCPPKSGSVWRGNFYRIDYDQGPGAQWAWDPATGGNFHDFKNFGVLRFA